MTDNPDLDALYDAAHQMDQNHRQHEAEWALAEAARAGTPKEALEVIEREMGVHL